jgi:hypothetical protein
MSRDFLRNADYIRELAAKQKLQEEEAFNAKKRQNQRRKKEAFLRYQQHLNQQFAKTYGSAYGEESFVNQFSTAFDGSNDFAILGSDASRKVQTLTMSVWAKPEASNRRNIFLNGSHSVGNQGIEIYWNYNQFVARINGTTQGLGAGNGQDEWTHVAIAYDGSTLKRMVNGVQGSDVSIGATILYTSYNGLRLSISAYGRFLGKIDEAAFWTSDQSANFATMYNGGVPGGLSSLSPNSWYRMGDGDTFPDLIDHGSGGFNGELKNMTAGDIQGDIPEL